MNTRIESIKSHIRDIPDFPKPGILFRDITPLLQDPVVFKSIIETLAERYSSWNISKIVAIESRGFVFATPLAYELGVGFAPLRKNQKSTDAASIAAMNRIACQVESAAHNARLHRTTSRERPSLIARAASARCSA